MRNTPMAKTITAASASATPDAALRRLPARLALPAPRIRRDSFIRFMSAYDALQTDASVSSVHDASAASPAAVGVQAAAMREGATPVVAAAGPYEVLLVSSDTAPASAAGTVGEPAPSLYDVVTDEVDRYGNASLSESAPSSGAATSAAVATLGGAAAEVAALPVGATRPPVAAALPRCALSAR